MQKVSKDHNQESIELINAYGPYAHGLWDNGLDSSIPIGNEEALTGRAKFLAQSIRNRLLSLFTHEGLKDKTIVDIGCYDGWLLCQLEDLPFKAIVGVEPRDKNIRKGNFIRSYLGISSRVSFVQGGIENLNEIFTEPFDIVLCTGLFHHLPSTFIGVKALRGICSNYLFLETICMPLLNDYEELEKNLELKDLPYKFGIKDYGYSGHKFESGYYDGSAVDATVVSIPDQKSLTMFLEVGGFGEIKTIVSPDDYSKIFDESHRNFKAICLEARAVTANSSSAEQILQYETAQLCTCLPKTLLLDAFKAFESSHDEKGGGRIDLIQSLLRGAILENDFAHEIAYNIHFAPFEKIRIELAKLAILENDFVLSKNYLQQITRKKNSDHRSVYRGFCMLSWLNSISGSRDDNTSNRYEYLTLTANPNFPVQLLGARGLKTFYDLNPVPI